MRNCCLTPKMASKGPGCIRPPTYLLFSLVILIAFSTGASNSSDGLYFTLEPEEVVYPLKRESFVWPCQAGGDLPVNITWEKDGVPVNDPRRHVLADGSLYFAAVDGRRYRNPDEGDYACIIRNEHGALRSRTVHLFIPRIGEVSVEPLMQNVVEGDVARFYCSLNESIPHANYSWQKDRKFIFSNDRYLLLPHGVLQVQKVNERDEGKYRCFAENVARRHRSDEEATLNVLNATALDSGTPPPPRSTSPPVIISEAWNFTVLENQNLILECLVSRRPGEEITVDWYFTRDGKEVMILDPLQMIWDNLLINYTTTEETGTYWCSAHSQATGLTATSDPSLVLVEAYPEFTVVPETSEHPRSLAGRVRCVATGVPKPTIRFYKDGKPVSFDGRTNKLSYDHSGETHLVINHLRGSDNGFYQCEAINDAGSVQTAAKITVKQGESSPGPPLNLVAKAVGSRAVLFTWDKPYLPDNVQLLTYTLKTLEVEQPDTLVYEAFIDKDALKYYKVGLEPYTNYSFSLSAFASGGASEPSTTVYAKTWQDRPLTNPEFSLISKTPYSFTVTWEPLPIKLAKGKIQTFRIFYHSNEEYETTIVDVDGQVYSYQATGLEQDTEYWVLMIVKTERGGFSHYYDDEWKSVITSDLPDQIEFNLNAINFSAVLVTWNPENLSNDTKYIELWYYDENISEDFEHINLTAAMGKYVITRLEPSTWYTVEMRACNMLGEKGFSQSHRIEMGKAPERKPPSFQIPPPRNVEIQKVTIDSVTFCWKEPEFYTHIESYTVWIEPVLHSATLPLYNTTNTEITVKKLKPSTHYVLAIACHITNFRGNFHEITDFSTPNIGPPYLINALATGPTAAKLFWYIPRKPRVTFLHYEVIYTINHQTNLTQDSPSVIMKVQPIYNGTVAKGSIDGIPASDVYWFAVRGVTTYGPGLASNYLKVKFDEYLPDLKTSENSASSENYVLDVTNTIIFISVFFGIIFMLLSIIFIICKVRRKRINQRIYLDTRTRNSANDNVWYKNNTNTLPMLMAVDTKGGRDDPQINISNQQEEHSSSNSFSTSGCESGKSSNSDYELLNQVPGNLNLAGVFYRKQDEDYYSLERDPLKDTHLEMLPPVISSRNCPDQNNSSDTVWQQRRVFQDPSETTPQENEDEDETSSPFFRIIVNSFYA